MAIVLKDGIPVTAYMNGSRFILKPVWYRMILGSTAIEF